MANYPGMFLSTSAGRILSPGGPNSGGGTVSNSLTVTAPPVAALGDAVLVLGAVSPSGDTVQIALSTSNTTAPTEGWVQAATDGALFAGLITPTADGTFYAWASDASSDLTAVSAAITVSGTAAVIGGVTPDELPEAAAAGDTDTAIVAQSGKVLFAQTFAAIWTWVQGHLPGYLLPQVNIATNVNLTNSAHNGRILSVTATGVTITALLASLGPGFTATLFNDSGSTVAVSGITLSTGTTIAANGVVELFGRTVAGNLVIWGRVI